MQILVIGYGTIFSQKRNNTLQQALSKAPGKMKAVILEGG